MRCWGWRGRGWRRSRALAAAGAHVVAWDSNSAAREKAGAIDGVLIHDPATLDLTGAAGLVVSPGVPLNTHPLVAQARAAGVPIIGDIELFAEARGALPPHRVVGITGTNGKSTTTALVHHMLDDRGRPDADGRQYRAADPGAGAACPTGRASMCSNCRATRST